MTDFHDGPPRCGPPGGVPLFAGCWTAAAAQRAGRIAVSAWQAGVEHAVTLPHGAGGADNWADAAATYRAVGLSGQDDPAYRIAMLTYLAGVSVASSAPPHGRHLPYLPGQMVVTAGGRPAVLTGDVSLCGHPAVLFRGRPAAVTLPRQDIAGPVVRVAGDEVEAASYTVIPGTLHDGDVLWVPRNAAAAVMYRMWPFTVGGPRGGRAGAFFEWHGGDGALAAADGGRRAASVAMARALLTSPGDSVNAVAGVGRSRYGNLMPARFRISRSRRRHVEIVDMVTWRSVRMTAGQASVARSLLAGLFG